MKNLSKTAALEVLPLLQHKHCREVLAGNRLRGAAIIEFALCCGLLLTLVAGLIDTWKISREQDLMLTASRHGARVAAARAHQAEEEGDLAGACDDGGGQSDALTSGVSLAYRYLVATGLETGVCTPSGTPVRSCSGSQFSVSSQFTTVNQGTLSQRAIRVSVSSTANRRCLFCFLGIFQNIRLSQTSIFAAEADCASLGP